MIIIIIIFIYFYLFSYLEHNDKKYLHTYIVYSTISNIFTALKIIP